MFEWMDAGPSCGFWVALCDSLLTGGMWLQIGKARMKAA